MISQTYKNGIGTLKLSKMENKKALLIHFSKNKTLKNSVTDILKWVLICDRKCCEFFECSLLRRRWHSLPNLEAEPMIKGGQSCVIQDWYQSRGDRTENLWQFHANFQLWPIWYGGMDLRGFWPLTFWHLWYFEVPLSKNNLTLMQ